MEKQQIIIDEYTKTFKELWLWIEAKHYIFNYIGWFKSKIISIAIKSELEWSKVSYSKKDFQDLENCIANLWLIHEKIQDKTFVKELELRYNKWLIDSKELISLLSEYWDYSKVW